MNFGRKYIIFCLAFALVLFTGRYVTSVSAVGRPSDTKWTICHKTDSAVHPYSHIVVSNKAEGGHFDAQGNPMHGGDILFEGEQECPENDDSVTIQELSLSCGNQKITFMGTATYKDDDRHLVINLDGQEILDNHEEIGSWSITQSVNVGNHSLVASIYSKEKDNGEHDHLKNQKTWNFTINVCGQTDNPIPSSSPSDNGGTGGTGGSNPGAPSCNDVKPGTPTLLGVSVLGANSVKVNWTKVNGANHYSIFYGPTSGNFLYSVPDTGDTDNFVINGLTRGCFVVRAVNGCQPGDPSAEVCTGAVLGASTQVLGASTLGATGTFEENLFTLFFILGSVFSGLGIRKIASVKVR